MTPRHSIPPFPSDIDRNEFAAWISGFTAGEGCFAIIPDSRIYCCRFQIELRADDTPVLELIRSFWQCGRLHPKEKCKPNPQIKYAVDDIRSVAKIVMPHFERFPVRAKKARDFEVWRQAVVLAYSVSRRPIRGRGNQRGTYKKWSDSEIARMSDFHKTLGALRGFESTPAILPERIVAPSPPGLFD